MAQLNSLCRCALESGKLPIHLLLSSQPRRKNTAQYSMLIASLRMLLELYPESLIVEVTNSEVRLCDHGAESSQHVADGLNGATVDSLPGVSPPNAAHSVGQTRGGIMLTIRDGSSGNLTDAAGVAPTPHRQFVRREVTWSPLSRLRESGDLAVSLCCKTCCRCSFLLLVVTVARLSR